MRDKEARKILAKLLLRLRANKILTQEELENIFNGDKSINMRVGKELFKEEK